MLANENLLLSSLGGDARDWLLSAARPTRLLARRTLIRPHQEIVSVVFPLSGIVSIVTDLGRGTSVEVALVGREGLVGARPLLVGKERFVNVRARVLVSGQAVAVPVPDFLDGLDRVRGLRERVEGFLHLQFTQAVQEVACGRAHRTDQRLARWLLHAGDRTPDRTFSMTQDLLSRVLGVRRATVTEAMGSLRDDGLIATARGSVTIVDRAGLEEATCSCYPPITQAFREYVDVVLGRPSDGPSAL